MPKTQFPKHPKNHAECLTKTPITPKIPILPKAPKIILNTQTKLLIHLKTLSCLKLLKCLTQAKTTSSLSMIHRHLTLRLFDQHIIFLNRFVLSCKKIYDGIKDMF